MDTEMVKKAKKLLGEMTLDEKIGMIHGAQLFETEGVPRLGIPPLKMSDGPMGVRHEFEGDQWKTVGYSDDYVTYLPCNSALAATWNRNLSWETGCVLGEEARGRGKDVILAPGINIKRSPLCGRNFEYFSEDPYLTGELAVPFIRGVQSFDVAACLKHFAVNNQETERLWVDVEIEEQVLRAIYLPAFHKAVAKGGVLAVMGAYNKLWGEHCCESRFLLDKILREEWDYDGAVISDWGAVHDTDRAARCSLDVEMSVTSDFNAYCMADPLKEKVLSGEISESVVDEKVIRILVLMMRLHMLDGRRKSGSYNTEVHRRKVLEAARESVVLLKNEKDRLPLQRENLKNVLLIGENANRLHADGGGSAEIKALYEISPLMGLKSRLGGNVRVDYARGYCSSEEFGENDREGNGQEPHNWQETSLEDGGSRLTKKEAEGSLLKEKRRKLRQEAVELAKCFDTVIYIGGLDHSHDCEGNDRENMKLPNEQDDLIRELLEVRPDMIVVMIGGSPVEMGAWIDKTDTLVWGWYAGMEGGNAMAEVLLGETVPSGKLPETFYKTHLDCSAHALGEFPGDKKVSYKEGLYVGYRYNDTYSVEPQFCFGHGLSYTTFEYSALQIKKEEKRICFRIKNTGKTAGKETAQLYIRRKKKDWPLQELIGFEKVFLETGEEKEVVMNIETDTAGCEILVGGSSRDIRLRCEG